jgi:hypothetical protein
MASRMTVLALLLALSACAGPSATVAPSSALTTTWGVQPGELRPDGLLINGLTPVDPEEHF